MTVLLITLAVLPRTLHPNGAANVLAQRSSHIWEDFLKPMR